MRIVFHSIGSFEINAQQTIRWEGRMVIVKILTKKRATDPHFWEYQARILKDAKS